MNEGLSVARRGGNKVHIPNSNLLETKDYETYVCHHPGQPFSVLLACYVLASSLKHMLIKPDFHGAAMS